MFIWCLEVWNLRLLYVHMLYMTFDPAKNAIPKRCTGRKWHIPIASNRKKSRRRIWLTKWDKVKAHDTFIDWCTGREWLLNCMTVISAWWRSNMPFKRLSGWLSGRLNYYITRWRRVGDQMSWRQDVVRKATTQQKGPSGPLMEFGDQLIIRCSRESQQSRPPGLRLNIRGTRMTQRWWP